MAKFEKKGSGDHNGYPPAKTARLSHESENEKITRAE
jgi:hypothetical protein